MNNMNLYKKVGILSAFTIAVGLLAYLMIKHYVVSDSPNKGTTVTTSTDLVKEALDSNPALQEVRTAFLAREYDKAIALSREIVKNSPSPVDRSIAETTIAQTQFTLKEYSNGAVTYYSIFNNQEYPSTTRAAALNNILQRYRASLDKEVLRVVLPNVDSLSSTQIYDSIYPMIYAIHPTGISSAWVGRMTLNDINRTNKESALEVYNKFSLEIDQDIQLQSQGIGSSYIVPNIYMAKARFMSYAYDQFQLSSVEEIAATYEKAANEAAARTDQVTQQFALLEYMDFLGRQNEVEKAEAVFNILIAQNIDATVAANVSRSNNWPGLAYLYTKSSLIRSFADKNSIKP